MVQILTHPLFKIFKKVNLKILKKKLAEFFANLLFQKLKKLYLQILKRPRPVFCLSCFQILKEIYLQILKKKTAQFFADHLFQILRKTALTNLKKKTWPSFLLIPFLNIKNNCAYKA